jgi:hypothetical protein
MNEQEALPGAHTDVHTYINTYYTQSPDPRVTRSSPSNTRMVRKSEAADKASSSKPLIAETEEEEIVEATQHEPDDDYEPEAKKLRADRIALSKTVKSPIGKATSGISSSDKSVKRGGNPAVDVLTALAQSAAAAKRGENVTSDDHAIDTADLESNQNGLKSKDRDTPLQSTDLNDSTLSMLATNKKQQVIVLSVSMSVSVG